MTIAIAITALVLGLILRVFTRAAITQYEVIQHSLGQTPTWLGVMSILILSCYATAIVAGLVFVWGLV